MLVPYVYYSLPARCIALSSCYDYPSTPSCSLLILRGAPTSTPLSCPALPCPVLPCFGLPCPTLKPSYKTQQKLRLQQRTTCSCNLSSSGTVSQQQPLCSEQLQLLLHLPYASCTLSKWLIAAMQAKDSCRTRNCSRSVHSNNRPNQGSIFS